MEKEGWNIFAPNLICVCVDSASMGEYMGRLWHQYSDEAIMYSSTMDLIRNMDALYEAWDFPQSSTQIRSFMNMEAEARKQCRQKEGEQMDARRIQDKNGDLGTFVVYVKYRQNSTWQGEVIWTEKKKKQHFRSALELLKLIDGALDQAEPGQEEENT